jgi:hypothetical protein
MSQPYGPPQPVTGISLPIFFLLGILSQIHRELRIVDYLCCFIHMSQKCSLY